MLVIGGAFLTVVELYNQIHSNTSSTVRLEGVIKDEVESRRLDNEIRGDRAEKRYKRNYERIVEIRKDDKQKDRQIEQLQKDVAFMKGQLKERL